MRASGIVPVCHSFIHSRELFLGIPRTLYRGVSYNIQRTRGSRACHTHAAIYTLSHLCGYLYKCTVQSDIHKTNDLHVFVPLLQEHGA